jgi:hypothetical protein
MIVCDVTKITHQTIPIILKTIPKYCCARLKIMPPTTLNLNHFKMVEDMGLTIKASRST